MLARNLDLLGNLSVSPNEFSRNTSSLDLDLGKKLLKDLKIERTDPEAKILENTLPMDLAKKSKLFRSVIKKFPNFFNELPEKYQRIAFFSDIRLIDKYADQAKDTGTKLFFISIWKHLPKLETAEASANLLNIFKHYSDGSIYRLISSALTAFKLPRNDGTDLSIFTFLLKIVEEYKAYEARKILEFLVIPIAKTSLHPLMLEELSEKVKILAPLVRGSKKKEAMHIADMIYILAEDGTTSVLSKLEQLCSGQMKIKFISDTLNPLLKVTPIGHREELLDSILPHLNSIEDKSLILKFLYSILTPILRAYRLEGISLSSQILESSYNAESPSLHKQNTEKELAFKRVIEVLDSHNSSSLINFGLVKLPDNLVNEEVSIKEEKLAVSIRKISPDLRIQYYEVGLQPLVKAASDFVLPLEQLLLASHRLATFFEQRPNIAKQLKNSSFHKAITLLPYNNPLDYLSLILDELEDYGSSSPVLIISREFFGCCSPEFCRTYIAKIREKGLPHKFITQIVANIVNPKNRSDTLVDSILSSALEWGDNLLKDSGFEAANQQFDLLGKYLSYINHSTLNLNTHFSLWMNLLNLFTSKSHKPNDIIRILKRIYNYSSLELSAIHNAMSEGANSEHFFRKVLLPLYENDINNNQLKELFVSSLHDSKKLELFCVLVERWRYRDKVDKDVWFSLETNKTVLDIFRTISGFELPSDITAAEIANLMFDMTSNDTTCTSLNCHSVFLFYKSIQSISKYQISLDSLTKIFNNNRYCDTSYVNDFLEVIQNIVPANGITVSDLVDKTIYLHDLIPFTPITIIEVNNFLEVIIPFCQKYELPLNMILLIFKNQRFKDNKLVQNFIDGITSIELKQGIRHIDILNFTLEISGETNFSPSAIASTVQLIDNIEHIATDAKTSISEFLEVIRTAKSKTFIRNENWWVSPYVSHLFFLLRELDNFYAPTIIGAYLSMTTEQRAKIVNVTGDQLRDRMKDIGLGQIVPLNTELDQFTVKTLSGLYDAGYGFHDGRDAFEKRWQLYAGFEYPSPLISSSEIAFKIGMRGADNDITIKGGAVIDEHRLQKISNRLHCYSPQLKALILKSAAELTEIIRPKYNENESESLILTENERKFITACLKADNGQHEKLTKLLLPLLSDYSNMTIPEVKIGSDLAAFREFIFSAKQLIDTHLHHFLNEKGIQLRSETLKKLSAELEVEGNKFSNYGSEKLVSIRFVCTKTVLDSFYDALGQCCIGSYGDNLLKMSFQPIRMVIEETGENVGVIYASLGSVDSKHAVILAGIDPKKWFINRVKPSDLYKRIVQSLNPLATMNECHGVFSTLKYHQISDISSIRKLMIDHSQISKVRYKGDIKFPGKHDDLNPLFRLD